LIRRAKAGRPDDGGVKGRGLDGSGIAKGGSKTVHEGTVLQRMVLHVTVV
jgi:hypothetical protein